MNLQSFRKHKTLNTLDHKLQSEINCTKTSYTFTEFISHTIQFYHLFHQRKQKKMEEKCADEENLNM